MEKKTSQSGMLILTRKLFEVVVVNDGTLVTYMGYCAATGVHTFSIAESDMVCGRAVTLRPADETIIGDNVVMKVMSRKSSGSSARLGFVAPRSIPIDRLEVHQMKARGKQ